MKSAACSGSDYIVCLEDGKKLKMLKRHLMTHYQMTPADYRAKWKLPADYPMVAPNYAETRKALALKIGLGRKKAEAPAAPKAKRTLKVKTPTEA
jgi:predicted transcriptional regulator